MLCHLNMQKKNVTKASSVFSTREEGTGELSTNGKGPWLHTSVYLFHSDFY